MPHRADFGVATSAQAACELPSNLHFVVAINRGRLQRLSLGRRCDGGGGGGGGGRERIRLGCSMRLSLPAVGRATLWHEVQPSHETGAPGLQCSQSSTHRRPRTWASVLAIQNSTPCTSLLTMLFTALEPPPPTPKTCAQLQRPPDALSGTRAVPRLKRPWTPVVWCRTILVCTTCIHPPPQNCRAIKSSNYSRWGSLRLLPKPPFPTQTTQPSCCCSHLDDGLAAAGKRTH